MWVLTSEQGCRRLNQNSSREQKRVRQEEAAGKTWDMVRGHVRTCWEWKQEIITHDHVDPHLVLRHSFYYISWHNPVVLCVHLSIPAGFGRWGLYYYQESRPTTHSWPNFFLAGSNCNGKPKPSWNWLQRDNQHQPLYHNSVSGVVKWYGRIKNPSSCR